MIKVLTLLTIQRSLSEAFAVSRAKEVAGKLRKRPIHVLLVFFMSIAALQTGQDFLHAYLHGYQGYWSDSLVFKLYWLPFIPGLGFLCFRTDWVKAHILRTHGWLKAIVLVLLLCAAHILLVTGGIVAVSHLFFESPFPFKTPFYYFASEHIYLTVFFYAAGFAYSFLYNKPAGAPAAIPVAEHPIPEKQAAFISVSVQNKLIPVPVEEIVCLQSDRPYVRIYTQGGSLLHAATLKEMLTKLAGHQFVRIHRSTIINMAFVASLTSRANGDYDVTLKNGDEVRMSRNYYPDFRKGMA